LGLENVREGEAFDRDLQEQRKLERVAEREAKKEEEKKAKEAEEKAKKDADKAAKRKVSSSLLNIASFWHSRCCMFIG
jgi:hypothetical protein